MPPPRRALWPTDGQQQTADSKQRNEITRDSQWLGARPASALMALSGGLPAAAGTLAKSTGYSVATWIAATRSLFL